MVPVSSRFVLIHRHSICITEDHSDPYWAGGPQPAGPQRGLKITGARASLGLCYTQICRKTEKVVRKVHLINTFQDIHLYMNDFMAALGKSLFLWWLLFHWKYLQTNTWNQCVCAYALHKPVRTRAELLAISNPIQHLHAWFPSLSHTHAHTPTKTHHHTLLCTSHPSYLILPTQSCYTLLNLFCYTYSQTYTHTH